MPRAKIGVARTKRRRRFRAAAKGYFLGRSKLSRTIMPAVRRAGQYAYRDRRARKREFRQLWIARITAACRMRGISYSRFMFGLKNAAIALDRKMLSEVAIADPPMFDQLVEIARENAAAQPAA